MQLLIEFETLYGEIEIDKQNLAHSIASQLKKKVTVTQISNGPGKAHSYISAVPLHPATEDLFARKVSPLPRKEEQSTFYCLFYPLTIYCPFGAENIHHAYNKAVKYWQYAEIQKGAANKSLIVMNYMGIKAGWIEVSQTLMTKIVKAWVEDHKHDQL